MDKQTEFHPKSLGGMTPLSLLLHGGYRVRCMELYLSCAYMPQCLLKQMSNKLRCHVLAAITTMFHGTGCAKELCNNSAAGVVSSSLNNKISPEQKKNLQCNLILQKSNFHLQSCMGSFLRIHSYSYAYMCLMMMITSSTLSISLHHCPLLRRGSTISKAIS